MISLHSLGDITQIPTIPGIRVIYPKECKEIILTRYFSDVVVIFWDSGLSVHSLGIVLSWYIEVVGVGFGVTTWCIYPVGFCSGLTRGVVGDFFLINCVEVVISDHEIFWYVFLGFLLLSGCIGGKRFWTIPPLSFFFCYNHDMEIYMEKPDHSD